MDDFRTLIASGFELPIINWCPPSEEDPSVGLKEIDTPKHPTCGKEIERSRQPLGPSAMRTIAPSGNSPADAVDLSVFLKTTNDSNGALQQNHSRAGRFSEPIEVSSLPLISRPEGSRNLAEPEQFAGKVDFSYTSQIDHSSTKCAPEPGGAGNSQQPFAVSRILLEHYNREELYEKVWTMSIRKVAEEYGVSHTTMGKTLKRLHIPVPRVPLWSKKSAKNPKPVRPPLPEVIGGNGEIGGIERSATDLSQGRIAEYRKLLTQYDREELYEKVWMMPLWRAAEEYGMSRARMVGTCKKLNIPIPGSVYWSKKAANKPVGVKPPLPASLSETSWIATSPEPLTVSAGLRSGYNREELYEQVWDVPMLKLAQEYGVSSEALGKTCRKLYIPVPGRGYWAITAAKRPVDPKPPLPEVQIKVGRIAPENCPQTMGVPILTSCSKEPNGPSTLCGAGTGNPSPQPLTVSRLLISRYDRQGLYEQVWSVPMVKLEKEFGISDSALRERFKRLHIPVPGPGYWQRKWANKPVEPRPPLPTVQIR